MIIHVRCQNSNSASSSKLYHWPLLALLVALVLHYGDSADLIFAILYMIIVNKRVKIGKLVIALS